MRFGKNVLSQNLRTGCDLALYLTLFTPSELRDAGLPEPIKSRPAVDSLQQAGIDQENGIYELLSRGLGGRCLCVRPAPGQGQWPDQPMANALAQITQVPSVILQAKMELSALAPSIFGRLGVSAGDLPLMPRLEGLIPDVIVAVPPETGVYEILPTAERTPVEENDDRIGLFVVDVKHARDPNPSYSAEVVLYAVMLANWLEEHGLRDSFLVRSETYLWTRAGVARDRLRQAVEQDVRTPETIAAAIREELEPINTSIYLQTIRRFFTEKLPAIIAQGNADWRSLEWGVGPSCGSCDWLAYDSYLSAEQREKVARIPDHYCHRRAGIEDHLSRIPLITRGARRVLRRDGIDTVASVAATTGGEPVYVEHSRLHADRHTVPGHAQAIVSGQPSTDPDRHDGLIARYADLDIFVSVNFDVGSGLVTGIGALANFRQHTPFGQQRTDAGRLNRNERWVTMSKSVDAERATILGFLHFLAGVFDHAHDPAPNRGGVHAARTGTQVIFWSERQFEELCLAVGRHLPAILYDANQDRTVRALAWLFPPEELQERDEINPTSPVIAFAQNTLKRLVRTPAEHALTLFKVAEHYRYQSPNSFPRRSPDSFYAEPFSDGIPRERVYEIWRLAELGGNQTIRWGSMHKTLSQLTEGYSRAMHMQAQTLQEVTWKLRQDFGQRLRAKADTVSLSIPGWTRSVAHDSKLFIGWASFENAYGKSKAFLRFFKDPEEVEASHEGIRLTHLRTVFPDGTLEYDVSPSSTNTKLRAPGDYLCLSVDAVPGFLGLRVGDILGWQAVAHEHGRLRMHHVFGAALIELDRGQHVARIRLSDGMGGTSTQLRTQVLHRIGASLNGGLTLMQGIGPDVRVSRLRDILREVGNPPNATPAPETSAALGTANTRPRPGTAALTPIARVLWNAGQLAATRVRPEAEARAIAASTAGLNPSQTAAVEHASGMALTAMWGPPGTGKTATCTEFIHGVVRHEAAAHRDGPYAILLTGPNYKAVGELAGRVVQRLAGDPAAPCRVYFVTSEARADDLQLPPGLPGHVAGFQVLAKHTDVGFQQLDQDLAEGTGIVLVATVTHQCPRLAEHIGRIREDGGGLVRPLFDLVLIDESSQVDMATGVGPLALLKERFQLVVAGDHLQMPPVFQVDPPAGAEYLVGSLQTYFVRRFSIQTVDLLENYRSNRDIVTYTKRLGYPAALEAANPDTRLQWLVPPEQVIADIEAAGGLVSDAWADLLAADRPIVGLTYPDGMAGQANPFEAACIAVLARALFLGTSRALDGRTDQGPHGPWTEEDFWLRGLGVVTPHRAQRAQVVQALLQLFPGVDPDLVEGAVDTVERFQGGQRHTILISFGVGDPDVISGEERFLLQLERTNVAVSRAMAKCILVMSEEMAGHVPDDRKAAESAHALRGIVDEWCNRRRGTAIIAPDGTSRTATVRWREQNPAAGGAGTAEDSDMAD